MLFLQTVRRRIALSCCIVLIDGAATFAAQLGENNLVIPMRLELELDQASCVVLENFTLRMRIVNPNDFPVILRGFTMGYIEPEVHVLLDDEKSMRLWYGAHDSAWTRTPVVVPPGGTLERHRFLYDSFNYERWPIEPGHYKLLGKTHLSGARRSTDGERMPIEWECPAVDLRVTPQTTKDRAAMEFLRGRVVESEEEVRRGTAEKTSTFLIRLYTDFLERHEGSAYAPEIKWELAKLLGHELANRSVSEEELPEILNLFEECLTFCLDKGSPYADDFLVWDEESGGGGTVLELVGKYKRSKLLKRLVEELDRKYPDDRESIMYRKMLVAGWTQSSGAASEVAREYRTRFPEGKHARHVAHFLEYIERQERQHNLPSNETTEP